MRYVDRVLSILLAAALLVLGVLVPVEIIAGYTDRSGHVVLPYERVANWAADHTWDDPVVVTIGAVVGVLGLILLVAELIRRQPGVLTLRRDRDDIAAGISRRSLRRVLATAAGQVAGVEDAHASLNRRRATVRVRTSVRAPGDLPDQVHARLAATLDSLDLVRAPKLAVRTHREES